MPDEVRQVKQVIVVRTKYPDGKGGTMGLRTGKLIAQSCHASMKVLLDRGGFCDQHTGFFPDPHNSYIIPSLTQAQREWINGLFTKICVYVKSEEELMDIYQKAKDANLPVALIEDAGLTEFKGIKTRTCCAIGPAYSDEIDKITGELPLL